MPRRIGKAKPKRKSRDTWQTELQLRPSHREALEDFAHALRKAGSTHRPGNSELVRGLLDFAEPLLHGVRPTELERLAVAIEGKSRDEAADAISAWLAEYLGRKVRIRKR